MAIRATADGFQNVLLCGRLLLPRTFILKATLLFLLHDPFLYIRHGDYWLSDCWKWLLKVNGPLIQIYIYKCNNTVQCNNVPSATYVF